MTFFVLESLKKEGTRKLHGIVPPITTPFNGREVVFDRLKENFQRRNRTKLSGYLVLGSNGDAVYLSETERIKVLEVLSSEDFLNLKRLLEICIVWSTSR